jgi:hypothetical protein
MTLLGRDGSEKSRKINNAAPLLSEKQKILGAEGES